jgi:Secretion system C-terminal sorting domain
MIRFFFITLLFACLHANAQLSRSNVWMSGNFGLKSIFSNPMTSNQTPLLNLYFGPGKSNICDTTGNLILSSDGFNIYDSLGNYILGGDTLVPKDYFNDQNGFSVISQSSIFLPMANNKYFFIASSMTDARYYDCKNQGSCFFDLLLYNIIDMNANGGNGAVTKRMQPLMQNASLSKTQMMACRHANGKDWWLLKQGGDSNIVYKFLFTQDSVYNMGMQYFNTPNFGIWDVKGQSVFTKDGTQYATGIQGNFNGLIFIANFNRCNSILSDPKIIYMPSGSQHNPADTTITEHSINGIAYSPNGQFLYAIGQNNIWQYCFADSSWFRVAGLDTTYAAFQLYSCSYLGNDDRLYIGNFGGLSNQMSVINNPNAKGAACDFCPRCLRFDSLGIYAAATTPPCMPNYALGADTSMCWPLAIDNGKVIIENELKVYPNPAQNILYIQTSSSQKRELYNATGQLILNTFTNEIDVSNFARGFYYLKVGEQVVKIVLE